MKIVVSNPMQMDFDVFMQKLMTHLKHSLGQLWIMATKSTRKLEISSMLCSLRIEANPPYWAINPTGVPNYGIRIRNNVDPSLWTTERIYWGIVCLMLHCNLNLWNSKHSLIYLANIYWPPVTNKRLCLRYIRLCLTLECRRVCICACINVFLYMYIHIYILHIHLYMCACMYTYICGSVCSVMLNISSSYRI